MPLGLNFGWLGEINLQCTLDKLFDGEFGCGYPPQEAERKRRDTIALRQISASSSRPLSEVMQSIDRELVTHALEWESVRSDIEDNAKNNDILEIYNMFGIR